jgi:thiol-disulfide isomerase/thioredoxin
MSTTDKPWRSSAAALVVAAEAAAVGFAAVYVTFGRPDNGKPAPPSPAMTAFVFKKTPEALADIAFTDGNKTPRTLKDFAGKTVLLNLWATWCTPCREEMPGLDRLQKALGSDKFEVVALSIDRGGADASRKFLDSIKVESLRLYVDATARAGGQLKAVGLPTTLLVDGQGREIGRFIGPAAWDGPDARRLIEASIK